MTPGGVEIEADTADEARVIFAQKYPYRTNGGNPKCTSIPINVTERTKEE